jgi:hypothetical protein
MNWNQILEKSWHYLAKRRYLFWLGVLAALTEGGSLYSGGSGYNFSANDIQQSEKFDRVLSAITGWLQSHTLEIAIVLIALFLIGLIILYISYTARAGLIYAIHSAEEGEESNFHRDFEAGKRYFWRFLGLRVLVAITLVLVLIIVILSFVGAFVLASTYSLWLMIPIALLCIPAIFGFVLLSVYLSLASVLAERAIVIKNLPIVESIDQAIHLARKNLGSVVLAWLINIVINFVAGIVYTIVLILPVIIMVALCVASYAIGKTTGLLVSIPLTVLILIVVGVLLQGVFITYVSAYWTLIYKKLSADS